MAIMKVTDPRSCRQECVPVWRTPLRKRTAERRCWAHSCSVCCYGPAGLTLRQTSEFEQSVVSLKPSDELFCSSVSCKTKRQNKRRERTETETKYCWLPDVSFHLANIVNALKVRFVSDKAGKFTHTQLFPILNTRGVEMNCFYGATRCRRGRFGIGSVIDHNRL